MSSRLFALELYEIHAIVGDKEEITLLENAEETTIAEVITSRGNRESFELQLWRLKNVRSTRDRLQFYQD